MSTKIIADGKFFNVTLNDEVVGEEFSDEGDAKRWIRNHIKDGVLQSQPEMTLHERIKAQESYVRDYAPKD